MSGKYYSQNKDVTTMAASKVYTKAPFSSSFTGETDLQKAGTNTTNVTLTGYQINGTTCTAVAIGHMPKITNSPFWSTSTPGTYTLTRTNSQLKIGSSTYSPSDFRDGVIPKSVVIFVVGGGGGGGGNGYFEQSKGVYARTCSGAGGGGGYAAVRVDISANSTWTIKVGQGGAAGSDGSATANSSGATGGEGYDSYAKASGVSTSTAIGGGGFGGKPGNGSSGSSSVGAGGNGGTGSVNNGAIGAKGNGGGGNQYGNHGRSQCTTMSFTPTAGTGDSGATLVSAKANNLTGKTYSEDWYLGGRWITVTATYPENLDDANGNGSYFSGGCSLGYGAYPYVSDVWLENGSPVIGFSMGGGSNGGGGGGGSLKSAGSAGYAAVYY